MTLWENVHVCYSNNQYQFNQLLAEATFYLPTRIQATAKLRKIMRVCGQIIAEMYGVLKMIKVISGVLMVCRLVGEKFL